MEDLLNNIVSLSINTISKVQINHKYIIRRKDKEQIVTIDNYDKETGIYEFNYGVYGFHEGCCKINDIRELTPSERATWDRGEYWNLPQQFYQSGL